MMTADFASSKLDWTSSMIDNSVVKDVKASGKGKSSSSVDTSGVASTSKSKDLDSLISTMTAKESSVPVGSGMRKKAKAKISKEDIVLNSIAQKYGIRKPKRKTKS